MRRSYFKIRKRFDFSPHRLKIGNPLIKKCKPDFSRVYTFNIIFYLLFQ